MARIQNTDPRYVPIYGVAEASRYLMIPRTTLQTWVSGTGHFDSIIQRPSDRDSRLSFANLVEAHVLNALRNKHAVKMPSVRDAILFAQREFGIDHLLISPELQHAAGDLFIERYGELINLSRKGQFAIKSIMKDVLRRVDYDQRGPVALFPVVNSRVDGPKVVSIRPDVSFGRPSINGKGISTEAIAQRYNAGEGIKELAQDYLISEQDVEEALRYEPAA